MNRREIQALRAFVETGSVAKAAERIYRTAPQVSRLLAALEEKAGFAILSRRGRQLSLTDRGRKFYAEALKLLHAEDELAQMANRLRHDEEDYLSVITAPFLANAFVNRGMAALVRSNPAVIGSINSLTRIELEAELPTQRFDLGVVTLPLISGEYDIVPFLEVEAVVACKRDHPLAALSEVGFDALAAHDLVATHRLSTLHRNLAAHAEQRGAALRVRLESRNGVIACQLAAAAGMCCLADPFMALTSGAEGIVVRPYQPVIKMHYGFVYQRWQARPETVLRLTEHIRMSVDAQIRQHGLRARLLS